MVKTSAENEESKTKLGPIGDEWVKEFIKTFYIYNLITKTPAGAEKEAVLFIEDLLEKAYESGKDYAYKDALRTIRNPDNQKPYYSDENPLAVENKAGWNKCLSFVEALLLPKIK